MKTAHEQHMKTARNKNLTELYAFVFQHANYSVFMMSWQVKKREQLGRFTSNHHGTCFNQLDA